MADLTLQAQTRTEFGKGAARRVRRAHQIPAVMYGHGTDPVHITLPGHETMLALKNPNALLTIVLDGAEQLALAKDVQRDPIRPVIEHVDLVVVRKGEKVTVDVSVHVVGSAAPDTFVTVESQVLQLEVAATSIPEQVEVSVEGLEAGSQIHAADITLPDGAALLTDADALIVHVTQQVTAEAEAAEEAAAASGGESDAAAEGDQAEAATDAG
jgi:large subunit ribosomal protein L25